VSLKMDRKLIEFALSFAFWFGCLAGLVWCG
jgi:hypothetical protein